MLSVLISGSSAPRIGLLGVCWSLTKRCRGRVKQWAWLTALLIALPLLSFLPRPSTSPTTIYLDIPMYDNNPDIPMYDNDSTKHWNSSPDSSVSSWVPTLASVYAGELLPGSFVSVPSPLHINLGMVVLGGNSKLSARVVTLLDSVLEHSP